VRAFLPGRFRFYEIRCRGRSRRPRSKQAMLGTDGTLDAALVQLG
jgi:hypothetical protein